MKTGTVPDIVAWKRGFEKLERFRRKEIRASSILIDAERLEGMLESARFRGISKPESGLGKLGVMLAKLNRR